jgi:MoxR-like ATPase
MVLATQNPREYEGTFPLPESQLDRFLMRVELGYPEAALARQLLLGRDRRDLLTVHEPLAEISPDDATQELVEPLSAGSLLLARSLKLRPVIHRGQVADAVLQSGALSISMKVEALEDGAPGQIIRVRNSQSRRDIRGKVMNEQTVLVSL